MRNIIAHEYFGVDRYIIWNNIKEELPILKPEINKIINEFDDYLFKET
jgi:uncharacterized protein with HEPN domain